MKPHGGRGREEGNGVGRWLCWSGVAAGAATGLAAAMVWVNAFLILIPVTIGLAVGAVLQASPRRRAVPWVLGIVAAGLAVAFGTYLVQAVAEMDLDDMATTLDRSVTS